MELMMPGIPVTVALAAVALIGYLFGRRPRTVSSTKADVAPDRRASVVAKELEAIAETLRRNLASHHASVAKFRERIASLTDLPSDEAWDDLRREADDVLKPTLHLASELARAYDGIRQQSNHLQSLTEARTDALTGIGNRRSLEESLRMLCALRAKFAKPFALAIFDIDHFKRINEQQGRAAGDRTLRELARLFDAATREADIVARFGGEEFVVLMPDTHLDEAAIFAERMRGIIQRQTNLTVSGGVAEARDGDDAPSILGRADVALYGAKAAGRNRLFLHDGDTVAGLAPALGLNDLGIEDLDRLIATGSPKETMIAR